jgi:hypothetical protein
VKDMWSRTSDSLFPPFNAGHAHLNLVIEPPCATERRVKRVGPIRRPDDDHGFLGRREVYRSAQEALMYIAVSVR